MQFLIISKKEGFREENINEKALNSNFAPYLISKEYLKVEVGNFIIFIYLYKEIDEEKKNYSYYYDENKLLLVNGILTKSRKIRNHDIQTFFKELKEDSELLGDYQLVSINSNGEGFIKTPIFSLKQLFYYEDSDFSVLSTEIKLIVDGVKKFQGKKFIEHFDMKFIEDSTHRESGIRKFPRHTIFKEIKRVLPHDEKIFKNGTISINRKSIKIPKSFKKKYQMDKKTLYDEYYKNINEFTEQYLSYLKPNIEELSIGLTGGFDSRLAISILSPICEKYEISLKPYTNGAEDHPDVIIAKKLAKKLNIEYSNNVPPSGKGIHPQSIIEYMESFYVNHGDFNSNNFAKINREIKNSRLYHAGLSAYKKKNINLINRHNIWLARAINKSHNFYFPLFGTEIEVFFALLYKELGDLDFKELVYEILKRSNPKLLEIPFVGDKLPQTNIEPFSTINESKFHEKIPFLWDYNYVKRQLNEILTENFNKNLGIKSKIILKLIGINKLDFFLDRKINKIILDYRKNKINLKIAIKKLKKEKSFISFIKTKKMVKFEKNDLHIKLKRKMVILMDYASVAEMRSFKEIEKNKDK
ncbi:hypothetical protein MBBAR_3c00330 [Methanobrevibacter arboriphilus JCM 13429 = DSM 1125]|uniref:Asparagine synthetase domain-containing protein n=1 Tax=Methanobrevibacter arboriphilus JCM 13429 = DSM 1125 TaxID=1300164 RepID=A0A1V6N3V7_METAZ|nr:hypothetical protein [Methanobrevibacter arboriphilus]OQD59378.1 hypothetical protein MBBAR_3c00330 [Methanobrevibacter arboriphilus JCM 13429 = DSM 1125]